jgi:putative membrane protein insertion efficiency factor
VRLAPAARRRLRRLGWIVLLLLPLGWDLSRPPAEQRSARALLAGIHLYQGLISPRLAGWGARCRFQPSCSHYAEAVIRRDGALVGSARALARIARCGPWTPAGTLDPP